MLFNNPIFANWYTDTVDVYRTVSVMNGSITRFERTKINQKPIPCRILEPENDGPIMTDNAARERSQETLSCNLGTDIQAGDELLIIRGGMLGHRNQEERYFAGSPVSHYDPVGGVITGLAHMEVGLLKDELVGGR